MGGVAQQSSVPIEMEATSSLSQPATAKTHGSGVSDNNEHLLSHGPEPGTSQLQIQRLESGQDAPVARSNWKIFATMIALSVCYRSQSMLVPAKVFGREPN